MKITEKLLWKYIEGDCTTEECFTIEQALEVDSTLKKEWLERKILHQMMEKQELKSPSMRFTKNVMESLPRLYDYSISKKQLRPFLWVVLGSSLIILLLAIFSNTTADNSSIMKWLPNGNAMSSFFLQDQLLFVGLAMGAVAVLLLLDQFMQKRLKIS